MAIMDDTRRIIHSYHEADGKTSGESCEVKEQEIQTITKLTGKTQVQRIVNYKGQNAPSPTDLATEMARERIISRNPLSRRIYRHVYLGLDRREKREESTEGESEIPINTNKHQPYPPSRPALTLLSSDPFLSNHQPLLSSTQPLTYTHSPDPLQYKNHPTATLLASTSLYTLSCSPDSLTRTRMLARTLKPETQ